MMAHPQRKPLPEMDAQLAAGVIAALRKTPDAPLPKYWERKHCAAARTEKEMLFCLAMIIRTLQGYSTRYRGDGTFWQMSRRRGGRYKKYVVCSEMLSILPILGFDVKEFSRKLERIAAERGEISCGDFAHLLLGELGGQDNLNRLVEQGPRRANRLIEGLASLNPFGR